jgi:hypothetical protein
MYPSIASWNGLLGVILIERSRGRKIGFLEEQEAEKMRDTRERNKGKGSRVFTTAP